MIFIIILTKNPDTGFKDVLNKIFSQKTNDDFELIIVDSGTTDGSLDIVQKSKARLI